VVVVNFTPVPRHGYRVGVPQAGDYSERLNTDSTHYGGGNLGNGGGVSAQAHAWMGFPASVSLTLPPLAALVLMPA
jgi:1,4-alpha-glucan branching enzyme